MKGGRLARKRKAEEKKASQAQSKPTKGATEDTDESETEGNVSEGNSWASVVAKPQVPNTTVDDTPKLTDETNINQFVSIVMKDMTKVEGHIYGCDEQFLCLGEGISSDKCIIEPKVLSLAHVESYELSPPKRVFTYPIEMNTLVYKAAPIERLKKVQQILVNEHRYLTGHFTPSRVNWMGHEVYRLLSRMSNNVIEWSSQTMHFEDYKVRPPYTKIEAEENAEQEIFKRMEFYQKSLDKRISQLVVDGYRIPE